MTILPSLPRSLEGLIEAEGCCSGVVGLLLASLDARSEENRQAQRSLGTLVLHVSPSNITWGKSDRLSILGCRMNWLQGVRTSTLDRSHLIRAPQEQPRRRAGRVLI